ncbi:coiled-coil domain-containing protein 183 [Podargus strigoides]
MTQSNVRVSNSTSRRCLASPVCSPVTSCMPIQVFQRKLQAEIYHQVNTYNLLLFRVRQQSQVRDELQRWLQQLQDAEMDKCHQAKVVSHLEKSIEKMLTKVCTGQKMTALYLVMRDALRKELMHLPVHLDLLRGMAKMYHEELEDMELMASDARKAADVTMEDMTRMEAQFLAEEEDRYHSLATQEVHTDRLWLKEAQEKRLRAEARYNIAMDFPALRAQDLLEGTTLEATQSQMEHKALVTKKMEKAKAAAQCSCLWDIPSRLLPPQKSSVDLEQYVKERKEKRQELKEILKKLRMKHAELKLYDPLNTTRVLEEELRMNLQLEEARLEQIQTQMLRNYEFL